MDTSIVATALVDIAKDFDDYIRIQWIVLSYLLTYMGKFAVKDVTTSVLTTSVGFALLFSRVSDVIGRKWTVFSVRLLIASEAQALLTLRPRHSSSSRHSRSPAVSPNP